MAFKIWQIGLHLQQQEAVAVAIVRGAKECFLQRWWRLPLENDIIKDEYRCFLLFPAATL
ncbi:hypothetical protein ACUN9Z_14400, partial [Escherichia sp. HC-CC4]